MTRLVELVSERTLVLIDEPEAHLHPPLAASFVRALSGLLAQRNGVAILATHSPVIAQEVPSNCVSLFFRDGASIGIERPEVETFAENVGLLTREIFRVEFTCKRISRADLGRRFKIKHCRPGTGDLRGPYRCRGPRTSSRALGGALSRDCDFVSNG